MGKVTIKQKEKVYDVNIYAGNALAIFICEYEQNGEERYVLYNFFADKKHCDNIIKDGKLFTAPTDELILPGIARAHLIRMCKKLGYAVSETPYDLDTLRKADEILVTSSSKLCMHCNTLDGQPVGGKAPEMLEDLRSHLYEEFEEATN